LAGFAFRQPGDPGTTSGAVGPSGFVPPDFSGFAIFDSLAILIIVFADNFRPLALRRQLSLTLLHNPAPRFLF
jgi:hypothetical protein